MRLHLVDGTFELFRAHHSKRPERPHKATAGLLQSLLWLLADPAEGVTHAAVAFDNPIRSFRNDLYAGYKSDEGMDPVLRGQFDLAEEAVRAAGVVVWSMREFEADDALATAASRWAPAEPASPATGGARVRGALEVEQGLAQVAVVGTGIGASKEPLDRALKALDAPPRSMLISPLRIAFLVPRESAKDCVRRLHAEFVERN